MRALSFDSCKIVSMYIYLLTIHSRFSKLLDLHSIPIIFYYVCLLVTGPRVLDKLFFVSHFNLFMDTSKNFFKEDLSPRLSMRGVKPVFRHRVLVVLVDVPFSPLDPSDPTPRPRRLHDVPGTEGPVTNF